MTEFKNGDEVEHDTSHGPFLYVGPHPEWPDYSVVINTRQSLPTVISTDRLTLVPKTYEITVTLTEEEVRAFGNDRFNRFGSPKGEAIQKVAVACREALGADR